MLVFFDSSAFAKRYAQEAGPMMSSREVSEPLRIPRCGADLVSAPGMVGCYYSHGARCGEDVVGLVGVVLMAICC